jgi:putative tryptophan/tyrosine transport system substrate-binding protein
MQRREFITLLGGAISAWPFAAHAQGLKAIPKVGFLFPGPEEVAKSRRVLLLEGLRSEGFREPDQVTLVTRATNGDLTRISPLLNELIAEKIDVLIPLGPAVTRTALSLTTSVPIIVFDLETDPIESGWLRSYAHPGGNITGIFSDFPDFSAKWLELLKEAVPNCAHIVVLWDPTTTTVQTKAIAVAAQQVHVSSEVVEIKGAAELDAVFETVNAHRPDGLLILSSPLVSIYSKRLAELALKYRMPAISLFSNFARTGGLLSYGPNLNDLYREAGAMAGKILKGTNPAILPAERPTRFEMIVNLQTAKALNLTMPTSILLRADEVIE